MTPWKAAHPTDLVNAIDTPALVLDLDAFERNLQRMVEALKGHPVRLRAHAKSHKCPDIARRQIALGAIGICCQKVSEAAVFVEAGINDVLVTNQVVGTAKLMHLADLTPADVYFGRGESILEERRMIKEKTIQSRRLQHQLESV